MFRTCRSRLGFVGMGRVSRMIWQRCSVARFFGQCVVSAFRERLGDEDQAIRVQVFFSCTVPLIRSMAYSLGTFAGVRVCPDKNQTQVVLKAGVLL